MTLELFSSLIDSMTEESLVANTAKRKCMGQPGIPPHLGCFHGEI